MELKVLLSYSGFVGFVEEALGPNIRRLRQESCLLV